ncbi:HvfC/BufC N-terminal domain-containing protein [Candidatus Pantoea soli]|uniref:DUF2063 domain-containing protein n=1 Tax=Candidatus Pantoea soli TaxID=3098669 RepID=A0A518XID4_9GAMM|nr:DNA-binding domain-containing protein [Pantoea soli]QDY43929.1 DUF2063 domain-containing protein [Pantoea soli]
MQRAFAEALLNPEAALPAGLTVWNGSDPAVRFAIYRNNVMASLVDVLADNFPVLQAQVGRDFFRAMAAAFIRQHPPASPVLASYGGQLASWMATFAPLASWPWLADMAALEFACVDALHAADRDRETVTLCAGFDPESDGLVLDPSLRVVTSSWAIFSIWCAHQTEDAQAAVDPLQAENVLLFRLQDDVRLMPVSRGQAAFVRALLNGNTLLAALDAVVATGEPADAEPRLLALHQHGLIIKTQEKQC